MDNEPGHANFSLDGNQGDSSEGESFIYATAAGPCRPPVEIPANESDPWAFPDSNAPGSSMSNGWVGNEAARHSNVRRQPPAAILFDDPEAVPQKHNDAMPKSSEKPKGNFGLLFSEVTDLLVQEQSTENVPQQTIEEGTGDSTPKSKDESSEEAAITPHKNEQPGDQDSDSDHLDGKDQHKSQKPVARLQLPSGWRSRVDPSSGKTYYWNQITGGTQWERPEVRKLEQPKPAPAPFPEADLKLPDGWTQLLDPSTNRRYYHNSSTGETTWERPIPPKAVQSESDGSASRNPNDVSRDTAGNIKVAAKGGKGVLPTKEKAPYRADMDDMSPPGARHHSKGARQLPPGPRSGLPSPGEILAMNAAQQRLEGKAFADSGLRARLPDDPEAEDGEPRKKRNKMEHCEALPFSAISNLFK